MSQWKCLINDQSKPSEERVSNYDRQNWQWFDLLDWLLSRDMRMLYANDPHNWFGSVHHWFFQNRTRWNGAIAAEPPNNWKDLQCGTLAADLNTWVDRFLLWENCSRVQQLGEQLVDLFCGKIAAELIKQLGRFILWHTCRRDKQVGIYILICGSAYAGRVMWALFKIKLHETASLFSVLYWSIITHGVKYLRFRIMVKQGANSVICCTVRTEKTKLDRGLLNSSLKRSKFRTRKLPKNTQF